MSRWLLFFLTLMGLTGCNLGVQAASTATPIANVPITLERRSIVHDGRERFYLLYEPPQVAAGEPLPLVFILHGGGGSPLPYDDMTQFSEKARLEGFILVYPAGTARNENAESLLTWNAGSCCGFAQRTEVDDVGFFRAMIAQLQQNLPVDASRIYVAGHSNGAMMSYRLAAEMSETFAAAGIVAGTIGGRAPNGEDAYVIPSPDESVSILHIHGMRDENLRYEGGMNGADALVRRDDISVADSIAFWVAANDCDPTPQTDMLDDDRVRIDVYACDANGDVSVKLITIVDGGHSWPGGNPYSPRADPPSERVNATDELWAFFAAHHK